MAFNLFMHDRNIYKKRPDFKQIAVDYPEFRLYAVPDMKGRIHIDFNNQDALRMLTKILLKKDFGLDVVIPKGFLIPTVPQRLNYLLWVEDLLSILPKRSCSVSGIDIGTGPCAIFALLGAKKNKWDFTVTETSDETIEWAEQNIKTNNIESHIKIKKVSKNSFLDEVLQSSGDCYDFCLCNPPFFESIKEIKKRRDGAKETLASTAKKEEILAEGGEVAFVRSLIGDSLTFKDRVRLYTSMFGRKKSYIQILKNLQNIKEVSYTKTVFCQGNTIRWGIAWTFLDSVDLNNVEQQKPKKKPKKVKQPLLHIIPKTDKKVSTVRRLTKWIKDSFVDLEIHFKVIKNAENFAEMQVASNKNTWSNQRRKRREVMREETTKDDPALADSKEIRDDSCAPKNVTSPDADRSQVEGFVGISNDKNTSEVNTVDPLPNLPCSHAERAHIELKTQEKDNSDCKPSKKTRTDSSSLKDSATCVSPESASKKRKREVEDSSENSKSQKLETKDSHLDEQDVSAETTLCIESKNESENTSEAYDLGKHSKRNHDMDLEFDSKSLLFCVLKIRKGEDHLLLEMNCSPEANRESMHQVYQFLKNKLAFS